MKELIIIQGDGQVSKCVDTDVCKHDVGYKPSVDAFTQAMQCVDKMMT